MTDERSIAVTPNQNSTIIEPNLKLKVCLWSSARRKIRESLSSVLHYYKRSNIFTPCIETTKLNELCWVGHSPLLLETAWKFEEEDIFASPDPLAKCVAKKKPSIQANRISFLS